MDPTGTQCTSTANCKAPEDQNRCLKIPQNRNSQETIQDLEPDYFKPKFQVEDRKAKEIHSHLSGLRFQTSKVGSDFIS